MRSFSILILSFLALSTSVMAQQSTFGKVYSIFQSSCSFSYCHSSSSQAGGMDLEGTGATGADKMNSVYAEIINAAPGNSYAAGMGYKRIMPGDPYRSFIFRKAHGGIAPGDIQLHTDEGEPMPQGGIPLEKEQAEIIRQWILQGAPKTGVVHDSTLIWKYHNGEGLRAVNTIPVAPAAGEGFQIHLGPFLLGPSQEKEFFAKFDPQLPADLEVRAVEPFFGKGYSHHFILYKFNEGESANYLYGLREENSHAHTRLVTAHQDTIPVNLPYGTAFAWEKSTMLDLNSHYINYSSTKVLGCDVYVNIYTQPKGTARQLMNTALFPNITIYIPNDGATHTFTQPLYDQSITQPVYVWQFYAHTHKYGTDYDVYLRNSDGTMGDHVYEGSCKNGIPGCASPNYDYQHPPARYFEPFMPLHYNHGIIHRASYRNTGTKPVAWGNTSDDEMMVMIMMYTQDTLGLGLKNLPEPGHVVLYPNPAGNTVRLRMDNSSPVAIVFYDALGKMVLRYENVDDGDVIDLSGLPKGLYIYHAEGEAGAMRGKLLVE
ncbi:MAG: T9SS type A sorting domain-containing protein [Bacteroidota bacterium]|nr:T9SS type A sorting domain-containing protein [Bacteroidota bacterium]